MRNRSAALLGALLAVAVASDSGVLRRGERDGGPVALAADAVVAGEPLKSNVDLDAPSPSSDRAFASTGIVEVARPAAWGSDLPPGGVALPATRPTPVLVRVEALGVDAPVIAVSVTDEGALDLPPDAATLAWFQHGATPGESGSAVLAGHVDYNGDRGALFRLADMPVGAVIEVRFDDGSERRFVTQAPSIAYPKSSLPVDELFRRGGPPVLTLVTCGGHFDRRARSYEDNVTVVAVPVKD